MGFAACSLHGPLSGGVVAMPVKVLVEFRPARQPPRDVELPSGATAGDVLTAVGQSPDATLVVRGEDPIVESEPVRDGERLMLLSAFSGG